MSTTPTTPAAGPTLFSTAAAAVRLGVPEWMVHRAFREGWVGECARVGRSRVIPAESVPAIERALRERGLIPDPDAR